MPRLSSVSKGRKGEDKAAAWLKAAGWDILSRNFRSRAGEIDIIATKDEVLAFIEVKEWAAFSKEELSRAIGPFKRRRIIETSKFFIARNRQYNCMRLRFDVILTRPGESAIDYIESAFMESV